MSYLTTKDLFSPNIRNKTRMSTFTTSAHHCAGGSAPSNQGKKEKKEREGTKI